MLFLGKHRVSYHHQERDVFFRVRSYSSLMRRTKNERIPRISGADWMWNFVCAAMQFKVSRIMLNTKGLEEELGFYGTYHQHPMNQLIHFFCVPLLWWSACIAKCYVGVIPLQMLGIDSFRGHKITW